MSERLSLQWPMICVGGLRRLPFTGLLQLLNGWADARLRLAGRAAPAVLSPSRYCCSDSQARGHRWAACSRLLSDPEGKKKLALSKAAARTMDATIYQIIFGELGDLNCSLIDAFQDTFMENASLSFLSADGKMDFFLFLFSILRCVAFWIMESGISVRLFFFVLLYFPPPRFILQCHNRWDWNLLAAEQQREDCGETLPWVHQRGEVQHNQYDIQLSWQKFCIMHWRGKKCDIYIFFFYYDKPCTIQPQVNKSHNLMCVSAV